MSIECDPDALKEFVQKTADMFQHFDQRISSLEKQMALAREAMLAMRDIIAEVVPEDKNA